MLRRGVGSNPSLELNHRPRQSFNLFESLTQKHLILHCYILQYHVPTQWSYLNFKAMEFNYLINAVTVMSKKCLAPSLFPLTVLPVFTFVAHVPDTSDQWVHWTFSHGLWFVFLLLCATVCIIVHQDTIWMAGYLTHHQLTLGIWVCRIAMGSLKMRLLLSLWKKKTWVS